MRKTKVISLCIIFIILSLSGCIEDNNDNASENENNSINNDNASENENNSINNDNVSENENNSINNDNVNGNKNDSIVDMPNQFENKTALLILLDQSTGEPPNSYNIVIFEDDTIAYVYEGIVYNSSEKYENKTKKLNLTECMYLYNFTPAGRLSHIPDENYFYSDIEKLNESSSDDLNNLIITNNFFSLNNSYLENGSHDTHGSMVYLTIYNVTLNSTKTVEIYDDGYHYHEDLEGYLKIKQFLENKIEGLWN